MENKIMDDSALEGVSGGTSFGVCRFHGKVAPGGCVVGTWYYVVYGNDWYYGQLEHAALSDSKKPNEFIYDFRVDLCNGLKQKTILRVLSSMAEIYTGQGVNL